MAEKTTSKKSVKPAKDEKEPKATPKVSPRVEKYFSGVGRRKRAIARIRTFSGSKPDNNYIVNGKDLKVYFPLAELQEIAQAPITAIGLQKDLHVSAKVVGGGIRGQAEACRLGVARALVLVDEKYRKALRDLGFLTRDDRKVERKKAGLKKARRAPQWKKR